MADTGSFGGIGSTARSSTNESGEKDPQSSASLNQDVGATAKSPFSIPGKGWTQVLKRVWTMWGFHNLSLLGAGVAFFVFLSITPLIAATVMIYGLVGDVDTVQQQMTAITEVLPSDAASLLERQMLAVVSTNGRVTGIALIIALLFSIYGGMRAANGLIGALNVINEEHETRGVIRLTFRAAWLTVAAIFIALTGLASAGTFAWLQAQAGTIFGPVGDFLFKILAWFASITLGSFGFALIMRYGPDRRPAKWLWLIPGAVLATLLWITISFSFSLYVAYISDYSATYGSLSAIVVFLMWLFLSTYGILAGALFNAELERQTAEDTTIGPAMPLGERGAVLADVAEGELSMEQWMDKAEKRAVQRRLKHLWFK